MDSAHLGKMTKREDGQKLNHMEGDIKTSTLQNRKVIHGLSKKQHQKEEKIRNRERLSLLGDGHKTGSGTQEAKQGNQWFPGTLE